MGYDPTAIATCLASILLLFNNNLFLAVMFDNGNKEGRREQEALNLIASIYATEEACDSINLNLRVEIKIIKY